eukprot:5170319-Pyramimonas_sp.AAC.3
MKTDVVTNSEFVWNIDSECRTVDSSFDFSPGPTKGVFIRHSVASPGLTSIVYKHLPDDGHYP